MSLNQQSAFALSKTIEDSSKEVLVELKGYPHLSLCTMTFLRVNKSHTPNGRC